ncbi:MAG: T9SS type A sorting domain-containing protein [Algicola sp.]|nr:T9SS type A sorting domain-containing protein [Algicola sp.]
MKKHFVIIYFFLLLSPTMFGQIAFNESAVASGLNASFGTGFVGGGISFCDFDNDGWDDVTLATESGEPVRFFKNNSGSFAEVFPTITDFNYENKQVIWIDYDNDGDKDLYVASHNASGRLYRNDGNLNLTDVSITSGIFTTNQKSFGASWGDYDKDGFLDVFLTYRSGSESNRLYHNNGDGTFSNVSNAAGISGNGQYTFCASFFDYNNDGWQDIYMANDRIITSNMLYHNNGDGTFTDVSAQSGAGVVMEAMSTTIGDYNNDGWLDIYITNTNYEFPEVPEAEVGNVFLRNNSDGTFTNVAITNGTAFNSIAWGAVFLDADNDMDLDLYVSGMLDGSTSLPSAFYENTDTGFSIPSNAGFQNDTTESYSNAIGDVDNDGYPDIIVCNEATNMFLWKNNCNTENNHNWLKVNLEGTVSNKDGIGSCIEISINGNKQYRYTVAGEGYLSQNSTTKFFGLGSNTEVDYLKVKWLSGIEDIYYSINANQTLNLIEGETLSTESFSGSQLKIYPNPFSDKVSIESAYPIQQLKLVNATGQVLRSECFSEDTRSAKLEITDLQSGYYTLIVTANNTRIYHKLIKR